MADISKLIQELAGTRNQDTVQLYQCEVNSVNGRTCNVTTINGTATLTFDAGLMVTSGDGVIITPTIGSNVLVLKSKYTLPIVVQYSDIERISFLGTEFGGLVKIIELTKKINDLENKVNEIITKFDTHTHASNGVPTTNIIGTQLTLTTKTEIENLKITHGG